MSTDYDAIIIGAGQSGPALAARLDREGLKTAIIERKLVGGTCVNVGCIPTKTLVGSARIAYLVREAQRFGLRIDGEISVDMKRVKARKDEVSGASNRGVTDWIEGMQNVTLIRGHARFASPSSIEVNGDVLEAKKIFVNVGARARVPDWPGLDEVPYFTNSSIMDVDFLPEHLIIVGGSYIGLEFAQMYRRFGSEVTVIEMQDRIIGRDDEDVSQAVQEMLEGEGVKFRLKADCIEARATRFVSLARKARKKRRAHTCWWQSAACPTRMTSDWKRPASNPIDTATSVSTNSCVPTFPESGLSVMSTARAHLHILPTTTTKSSQPTCSTTTRANTAIASSATDCSRIRRWDASASRNGRSASPAARR
jgi:pyruvate/2-oxoglutarate dehydrogenase complex dihydrolipoamide dehydrogenase (E3) component